jgi:hypothetical protein
MSPELFSAVAATNANHRIFDGEAHPGMVPSAAADDACGTALTPMSDEEREQAAYRAGVAMQAWYSAYQHSGNTSDLDRAYHCMGIQKRLLAGRSPEFVAQLEKDRGLA